MVINSFQLLTLQEAMDLLQISRSTINRWRRDKGLPCIKIGKEVFVDRAQLIAWVKQHEQRTVQKPVINVTIGYQSMNAHLWSALVIKEFGLLEEAWHTICPAQSLKANWMELSGPRQIEALAAGQLDIASLGDFPLVAMYQISSLLPSFTPKLLAFDGKNTHQKGVSFVLPRKTKLQPEQIADYAVSTIQHSSSWHRLTQSGLFSKATMVYQNENMDIENLRSGQLKASTLIEPYASVLAYYQLENIYPLEGCADDYLAGIAADESWIAANEEVVLAYMIAHLRAHQMIRQSPIKVSQKIASVIGFPIAVVTEVLDNIRWDAAIYEKDLLTLGRIGKAHYPTVTDWVEDIFDIKLLEANVVRNSYLQEAAALLQLPAMDSAMLREEWIADLVF